MTRTADLDRALSGPRWPAGAGNFRSLGGLLARDGRRLRPHFLMRSDRLAHLTPEGWEQLATTGLTTICDLRSGVECAEHPNRVPAVLGIEEVACEVDNDLRGNRTLRELIVAQPSSAGAEALMIEIYRRLPQQTAPALRRIVDRLLGGGAPLLIHCTAGKDRTGFVMAMLLHALGVPHDDIERDYLASSTWLHAPAHRESMTMGWLAQIVPADAIDGVCEALLGVRTTYLRASLDAIGRDFGSVERYFDVAIGLDAAQRERLRDLALL
jgi:protein-tyrosine phosphatase